MTFDHGYDGTGNWPFNTAYAAALRPGTRSSPGSRSLREAERFITAGIPVVASITFGARRSSPAPRSAPRNGHLVVVVGFTATGDVVVNDPAAPTRAGVRRTYDRGQFEDAWLQRYPTALRGSAAWPTSSATPRTRCPARAGHTNW